jgi:hypothetical protein
MFNGWRAQAPQYSEGLGPVRLDTRGIARDAA